MNFFEQGSKSRCKTLLIHGKGVEEVLTQIRTQMQNDQWLYAYKASLKFKINQSFFFAEFILHKYCGCKKKTPQNTMLAIIKKKSKL